MNSFFFISEVIIIFLINFYLYFVDLCILKSIFNAGHFRYIMNQNIEFFTYIRHDKIFIQYKKIYFFFIFFIFPIINSKFVILLKPKLHISFKMNKKKKNRETVRDKVYENLYEKFTVIK